MQSPSTTPSVMGGLGTSSLSTTVAAAVIDHLRGGRPREPLLSTPSSSTPSAAGGSGAAAVLVVVVGKPHRLCPDLARGPLALSMAMEEDGRTAPRCRWRRR
uniref:Uncharacterized protein n=1 Tax=Oryza barthii TaxID=65489 RepID=A0A0D3GMZ1_9ORYZ